MENKWPVELVDDETLRDLYFSISDRVSEDLKKLHVIREELETRGEAL